MLLYVCLYSLPAHSGSTQTYMHRLFHKAICCSAPSVCVSVCVFPPLCSLFPSLNTGFPASGPPHIHAALCASSSPSHMNCRSDQSLEIKPAAALTPSSHIILLTSPHLNSGQVHLNKPSINKTCSLLIK